MFTGAVGKIVNKLKDNGQIDDRVRSQNDIETTVVRLILGIPDDVVALDDIIVLFGVDYEPGTFMIGEIEGLPDFFPVGAELGYDCWVRREIRSDIQVMKAALARQNGPRLALDEAALRYIDQDVVDVLGHRLSDGTRLCDRIPLQEYTDVFRRIIMLLLLGDADVEINTYEQLNRIGRELALRILSEMGDPSLFELLKISIASGLLGLNLKTSASATSEIHQKNIIPIHSGTSLDDQIERIRQQLMDKAAEDMAIDYWPRYERDVLRKREVDIAFFADDYIETMFDLKFIERQLQRNEGLVVHLIPRFRRYGNDACYDDVMGLLDEPAFEGARLFHREDRLRICEYGPRSGTVNGLSISQGLADILKMSDCVVVKGARSYEMLQGLRKMTYFGFAVCREISESVTGIDAEKGKLVFIGHVPGARSFEGFRNRGSRSCLSDSGREILLSTTTAMDYYGRDRRLGNV